MKMPRRSRVTIPKLLLAASASVCALACGPTPVARDDRGALEVLRREHVEGVNARDADAVLGGMAEDVVYLAPGLAPVVGRDSLGVIIRAVYQQIQPGITMTPVDVAIQGNEAVEWGCLGGRILPLEGGDAIPNDGKYVFVYRWRDDTGWKITRDIYNAGPCPGE